MQKYRSKAINISDEVNASSVTLTPVFVEPATSVYANSSDSYRNSTTEGQFLHLTYAGEINEVYSVPSGVNTKLLSGMASISHTAVVSYSKKVYRRTGTVTARTNGYITVAWNNDETEYSDPISTSNTYTATKILKINNTNVSNDFGTWVVGESMTVFADQYIYLESADTLYEYSLATETKYSIIDQMASSTTATARYLFGKSGSSLVAGDTITVEYSKIIGTPTLDSNYRKKLIRLNMIEEYDE